MRLFLSVAALFIFAASVFSQTGTITGKIVDKDGRLIHQASVRISELKRQAISNDDGVYTFDNVPPGRYAVTARQEGFTDVTKTVEVQAGTPATLDFELQISALKEEVTVTAAGSEQSTFNAIASVSSVPATGILGRASVGLGDVLEQEPGVAKRSAGPGASRPVIRGFDGDRVLVATDGVRVGSLAAQSGDHSEPVDTLAQERIEVVKGPATLLYGSNAIGGVVNAISGHDEDAHPGLRGYLSLVGGTANAQAAGSAGVEYGYKNWMVWGTSSGQRTSDYSAGGDYGKVLNSFTRNAAGSLGGGYYGGKAYVNATYNYYQNRYGIPLDLSEEEPEERSIRVWRNDVRINGGYNNANAAITGVKFTLDTSNYRHQEIADDEVGTTFFNRVFSYRGMFEQKKYNSLSGRFGFDGFQRFYQTVGDETLVDGPVKHRSLSAFALEELQYKKATFQFGARVENNTYRPKNPALIDRSFTGFSGAAGVRIGLWDNAAFVANYSHSYRAPALDELYNFGPHDGTLSFEIGDVNMRAETSDGIDLSLRQRGERFSGEANFYYYRMHDFIFLAPTGLIDEESGLPINRYMQGDSRFVGTELSGSLKLNKYLSLTSGLDYVNAELSDGTPLPRIAPLRGRAGLDIHYHELTIHPEAMFTGDQDRVFVNETRTPGYAMFNVTASYLIATQHFAHIFTINAFNLTDRLAYNHISFIKDISPEIGRGVRFGYTVRFF